MNDADKTSQKSNQNDSKENIVYKKPEFILIDDRKGGQSQTHYDSEGNPTNDTESFTSQRPFPLRFLCFLGVVFCLVFGLGLLVIASLATLGALVFLLQNQELNQSVATLWKLYVNVVIAGLGCVIGVFNPAIGIGLMAVYFSLSGEHSSSDFLKNILKRFFKLN
jgi:hypothetical protein